MVMVMFFSLDDCYAQKIYKKLIHNTNRLSDIRPCTQHYIYQNTSKNYIFFLLQIWRILPSSQLKIIHLWRINKFIFFPKSLYYLLNILFLYPKKFHCLKFSLRVPSLSLQVAYTTHPTTCQIWTYCTQQSAVSSI